MPLIPQVLETGLRALMVYNAPEYAGTPANGQEFAARFSSAVAEYAQSVAPPTTGVLAGQEQMRQIIAAAYETPGALYTGFPQAFAAMAASMAAGMLPAFAGTPPPLPLDWSSVYALGNSGAESSECIALLANLTHAWFLTGTAVNTASGATTLWL